MAGEGGGEEKRLNERGFQITIDAELIRAIRSKFPYMAKLKPRAIVEIALGKLLIDRSSPSQQQTVIQVPVPPVEKVRVPQELEDQEILNRRAARDLERDLERLRVGSGE